MSATISILGPLVALASLFIGAYLTRNRELEKVRKDRVAEVYTEFIKVSSQDAGPRSVAINQKQFAGHPLSEDEMRFVEAQHQNYTNAKSNILIYGSERVIGALSDFYDCGAPGTPPERGVAAFVALIRAMRDDSDAESYAGFDGHVDNIIGLGPQRRLMAMQRQMGVHAMAPTAP